MKASMLDGIWGQDKAAAEEFQHKNWYCILLIKLHEVKQDLCFQISMSTTANAAKIVILSVFMATIISSLLFLQQFNFVMFIGLEGTFILGFFAFCAVKGQNCQERFIFGEKESLFKSQSKTSFL